MEWVQNLNIPNELKVIIVAMIPFFELKGAIPIGLGLGLGLSKSFWLSYVGSMIPVPILLFLLRPVLNFFESIEKLKPLAEWIRKKCQSKRVQKYSLWGLFTYVGIPLPGTGVWTGSGIATLLDMRVLRAFPTIAIANFLAGVIVMAISYGVLSFL